MPDQLHQINIQYVPVQDRLLMRINTKQGDEYRIWLTRRYSGLLAGMLGKEIDKLGGIPALASSDETRTMFKQGAMEKPYEQEKISGYPLGEQGVLGYKINYRMLKNGQMILELQPETGQGMTLNLNKSLLFMFYNLLTQALGQTDWHVPDGGAGTVRH